MPDADNNVAEIVASKESIAEIDKLIDKKIDECTSQLARQYWELGNLFNWMKNNKHYRQLGFKNWEDYLASKRSEFGRSYQSYLLKLGKVNEDEIAKYLSGEISGTKLIEFIKKVPRIDDLPKLLEAQWEVIKDKPVREAGQLLEQYVKAHANEFGKKRSAQGAPKKTLHERLKQKYVELTDDQDRANYVEELEKALAAIRSLPGPKTDESKKRKPTQGNKDALNRI